MENLVRNIVVFGMLLSMIGCSSFEEPVIGEKGESPHLSMDFNGKLVEFNVIDGAFFNHTHIDTILGNWLYLSSQMAEEGCISLCPNSFGIGMIVNRSELGLIEASEGRHLEGEHRAFDANFNLGDSVVYTLDLEAPNASQVDSSEWCIGPSASGLLKRSNTEQVTFSANAEDVLSMTVESTNSSGFVSSLNRSFNYYEVTERDHPYLIYTQLPDGFQVNVINPSNCSVIGVQIDTGAFILGDDELSIQIAEDALIAVVYNDTCTNEAIFDIWGYSKSTGVPDIPSVKVVTTAQIDNTSSGQGAIEALELYYVDAQNVLWLQKEDQPTGSVVKILGSQSFAENEFDQSTVLLDLEFDLVFERFDNPLETVNVEQGRAVLAVPVSE